jgi:Polysaccharide lyase
MAGTPFSTAAARALTAALVAAVSVGLLLVPGTAAAQKPFGPESARAKHGKSAGKQRRTRKARARVQRRKLRRLRRLNRTLRVSGNAAVARRRVVKASDSSSGDVLDAGCEGNILNWNTAGVGEVLPTLASDIVRDGGGSCRMALSGTQHRSELILGGNGGRSTAGMVEFHEGDEYWYAFSFYIGEMTYGRPGAHNLIMQFKGDDDGSPYFGLQLWDYEGDDEEYEDNPRGLWSHGVGMDGDRFLALAPERIWHDVAIHMRASQAGNGFYEVYLNGELIDSAQGVSTFPSGAEHAYIKQGLYRNGDEIPGDAEIRLDAARLGSSFSAVAPS